MPAVIQLARVLSQNPSNYTVNVMFPSTQTAAIPVRVGVHGPADGVRIKHAPLPTRGSYGLVAFPNNDHRGGVWVCSVYSQMMDALTSDTDPALDYHSHLSGYYDMLDENGHYVQSFPDGTSLVVSDTGVKPTTYRHVVNQDQTRSAIPFTDASRTPNKPAPFHIHLQTASGVTLDIDPTGNVALTQTGGGNIAITTPNKITTSAGTIVTDAKGGMTITSPSTISITAGNIVLNGIDWSSHMHGEVQSGGSETGPPE
jgi:phage baseplate assembly protein gpV